jgi:hypothetical protein
MSRDDGDPETKPETGSPVRQWRLDKAAFSVVRLGDDSADKAYWLAQSPQARLKALELMRQVAYGYNPATARLERVFEVIRRTPR